MSQTTRIPSLDACAAVYVDVWETFEDDPFDPDDLDRHLLDSGRPDGLEPHGDEVIASLAFLVGAGALSRLGDGRLRACHRPDVPPAEWSEDAAARADALAAAIARAANRDTKMETETETETPPFRYRGERYARLPVPPDATVESLDEAVVDAIEDAPDVAGVGLYAPADAVAPVQRVADRLCDESPPDGPSPRFEKETSEVATGDDGDLEFRLYLRAV
ncbi:hypothetical protein [Halomarina pelagica]|uniref:hypothetical protein n=1 Tax=Halomarina pelagica TaxID=2961599 RepID=UPI0020C33E1E|nr:hypothetical protein [Halomarina sp. BND7]